MDDYDFVRRLERRGRTACLPGPAVTSARRWQRIGLSLGMLRGERDLDTPADARAALADPRFPDEIAVALR